MPTDRKSIFITGAGSGIGRATAHLFSERGWFVGAHDVNAAALAETAQRLTEGQHLTGIFDVREPEAWRTAVAAFAETTGGKMHVLFNNAGIAHHGAFADIREEDSARIVDVNLKGVINGIYAALPLLRQTQGAHLINTASASAFYGSPTLAVYSATKFAVRGLTEALDVELRKDGITCTCVLPWFIETPLLDGAASGANTTLRQSNASATIYPVSDVAETVWKSAHGEILHAPVGGEAKRMSVMARLFPGLVRRRLHKMFAPPA